MRSNKSFIDQRLYGSYQENLHQAIRLREGTDPDEHTIYNVLCPAIRAKWSKREEHKRRVTGKRLEAVVRMFRDPEAFINRSRVG